MLDSSDHFDPYQSTAFARLPQKRGIIDQWASNARQWDGQAVLLPRQ